MNPIETETETEEKEKDMGQAMVTTESREEEKDMSSNNNAVIKEKAELCKSRSQLRFYIFACQIDKSPPSP